MKTINVVAAVIKKGNKILATQRGYGEFKDGWEFPGGKIEAGETPAEAIVREIKEELDAKIKVEDNLGLIEYDYPNFHLHMECFLCSLVSADLTLLEHEDMKWLTAETMDNVDWLPADVEMAKKVQEILKTEALSQ
ncbi:8-oxo-dGTP diphosphatase [Selenomonas ruminantium]|uniref:8-oxo-dGTP diphosphatase n=1 Tax=Selenomonas ruminantium TaxID=971 RepID=A0A1M6VSL3_SELRU|nr:(deoxy)nucleoside triphosphate pyrophosphohydrolase [Selenomonas ruminantium]SHK84374.1 8-oxo-dGTP diphosphatase [Selenomonas ruminantium]